jgi:tripartite-type tricarboxylate transporter receptor subunit TctC
MPKRDATITKRRFLSLVCAGGLVYGAPSAWQAARAQSPSRPIKFIIPYPPGGVPDTVARVIGRRLQERLGQTVVVENRSGASGSIAVNALIGSPADGQTFVVSDGAILSINPQVYGKLSYDPKAVAAVAYLAKAPLFLAIHAKVPVDTIQEFIEYVRARPGELNYGSSGVGSTHHISMEGFKSALKLNITHVPFKGAGESVSALLGGHVEALFSAYPALSGAAGTNSVKLLATNGAERSSQAPDLPAISEFIPEFNFASNLGIYARVGTSAAVMQKIAAEASAIVKEPDVISQLAIVGVEAKGGGPDEFERVLKDEIERVGKVVKTAGIRLD